MKIEDRRVIALNGSVQGQGIKLDFRDWLDIGSEGWKNSSEAEKAYAYQASMVSGWTNNGLKSIILSSFAERIDEATADLIIELLQDFSKSYPAEIVGEQKNHVCKIKKDGVELKIN